MYKLLAPPHHAFILEGEYKKGVFKVNSNCWPDNVTRGVLNHLKLFKKKKKKQWGCNW